MDLPATCSTRTTSRHICPHIHPPRATTTAHAPRSKRPSRAAASIRSWGADAPRAFRRRHIDDEGGGVVDDELQEAVVDVGVHDVAAARR